MRNTAKNRSRPDKGTTARLVSARPDGSGLRTLTHPKAEQFHINADVSPDGSRVLFERDLPLSSVLGTVGASGLGERTVPVPCTGQCNGPQDPGWTADGRRIGRDIHRSARRQLPDLRPGPQQGHQVGRVPDASGPTPSTVPSQ
jgi:hypothetical protein